MDNLYDWLDQAFVGQPETQLQVDHESSMNDTQLENILNEFADSTEAESSHSRTLSYQSSQDYPVTRSSRRRVSNQPLSNRVTPQSVVENRNEKRRERNRLAARKSRERRLTYIAELEDQVSKYRHEVAVLTLKLQAVTAELNKAKEQLKVLQPQSLIPSSQVRTLNDIPDWFSNGLDQENE